jgi:hypothetical protein
MKVSVSFSKKVPGTAEYSSDHFSLSIEAEPPAEVQQDRERLRKYTEELFAECKARVEDQVVAAGEREPASAQPESSSRSAPVAHPPRAVRRPATNGNSRPNGRAVGNGHQNGEPVSLKQIGYVRSLARDAGYTNDQLAFLCEEATGKADIRALSKREASALIDTLRQNAA